MINIVSHTRYMKAHGEELKPGKAISIKCQSDSLSLEGHFSYIFTITFSSLTVISPDQYKDIAFLSLT